jgi:hypothetical protein
MLCLVGGKWATQIADEIAQVFRKMLHTHLVEVIASLFVWHDNETKHFFDFQLYRVLRFFWVASICSVNIGEISLSGSQKSFPKCSVVENEGDGSPLNVLWCHVTNSPFA